MDFGNLFSRYVHPEIIGLARYLAELAGDEALPCRSLFDPGRISAILDFVYTIDFLPEENDYLFRLSGSGMTALFGSDLGGMRLSEVGTAQLRDSMRKTYDRAIQTRRPLYMRGYYVWADKSVPIERLLVPMLGDDGKANTICGIAVPQIAEVDLKKYAGLGSPDYLMGEEELMLYAS